MVAHHNYFRAFYGKRDGMGWDLNFQNLTGRYGMGSGACRISRDGMGWDLNFQNLTGRYGMGSGACRISRDGMGRFFPSRTVLTVQQLLSREIFTVFSRYPYGIVHGTSRKRLAVYRRILTMVARQWQMARLT